MKLRKFWAVGGAHAGCAPPKSATALEVTLAVVKSFEYKIAIFANFVQTVKNSNDVYWNGV